MQLEIGDLVVVDMTKLLRKTANVRIGKVTGLPQPNMVRVRHWLSDKHRFSEGETTYHVDWLKEMY